MKDMNPASPEAQNLVKRIQDYITENMYTWIDVFKKYQNITTIERKTVVELIEEVIVHEDKKISIRFRYGDQYTKLAELLGNYSSLAAE